MDYKKKVPDNFKDVSELSKDDAKEQIEKLRDAIEYHNYLYYIKNDPVISDSAYDKLFKRLQQLEGEYPEFESDTSPTKKVGTKVVDELKKVKHTKRMLSLNSVDEEDEIKDFHNFVKKRIESDNVIYVAEPKFDGLSVEIVYENAEFKYGATRGDSKTGEDISENLKTVKSLPLKLHGNGDLPSFLAVRGEVYMTKTGFQKLNKKLVENGKEPFSNPRNAAAGTVRQLDSNNVADKPLDIFFYEILKIEGYDFDSHLDVLKKFPEWGLKTTDLNEKCKDAQDIIDYREKMEKKRDDIDFEIDGVVIKINDYEKRKKLGVRQRNPRWAIAYKFPPKKEITTIEDIVIQVGRTGQLTPVALLDPVDIEGVTVSRASLHNEDEVRKKNIHVGDKVRIARAGDVIPEVVERVDEKKTKSKTQFSMPDKCPSCNSDVEREGALYFCTGGLTCKPQLVGSIMHFASKDAFDIKGLGEETVKTLVDKEWIKDLSDLYKLGISDFKKLEGFAEKSAKKLYKSIQNSKEVRLDTFLYALGIRHVGMHIAEILTSKFEKYNNVKSADKKELQKIDEIGPEIADSIFNFFNEDKNVKTINALFDEGIKIKKVKGKKGGLPLQGKKIVFTGALESFTRSQAKKKAKKLGARVTSNVSSNTDYVVAGEDPGKKYDKAEQEGVKILSEDEFKELINE